MKSRSLWSRSLPALAFTLCSFGFALGLGSIPSARADVEVGAALESTDIEDANKQPAKIPGFGEKVLLILYTDPDVADQNDAFADQVKAQNLDKTFFQSIGIANMQDAPAKPNWIIRAIIRSKIKKYGVTILADPKLILANQWKLGACNDKSVVLIIGKDKTVKYFHKGPINVQKDGSGKSEADAVIDILKKQIAEAGGPAS
jgi:predicted transcriptional regulator